MELKLSFCDLNAQYESLKEEIDKNVLDVIASSRFIGGPQIKELEEQIAQYCDSKHGLGVANGTDALQISLMALDLQPGDEVITTPFTFIATAEMIALLKAKPVFVDIDEKTYNIDVNKIEEKITDKTKAIIPVHLYGQMADMDKIMEIAEKHNIKVIEDAAQAIGAKQNDKPSCSIGHMGILSFFPAKNLGCYGDGGMVVTNDDELADKIRVIKNHGQSRRYVHSVVGVNSRLDTIQAAILLVKLKHLESWIESRNRLANRYIENFQGIATTPYIKDGNRHVFNQFSLRIPKRDELLAHLNENGIPTAIHYPMPLHLQEVFQYLGGKEGDYPIAEQVSKEICSLPMFPEMKDEQQDIVINAVKDFFKE